MKSSHKKLFLKASLIMSIAIVFSKISGMVKEQYTLYLFGAGWELDAFISASKIPSALRNLLGEGAFSAVFVAMFSGIYAKNKKDGIVFANQALSLLMVISLGITLLGMLTAPFYLPLIHKSASNLNLAIALTYWIMPFLPFISLAAVVMGILNSWEIYFIPALAPLFGNIVFLICVFFLTPHYGPLALALGFFASSVIDLGIQLPVLFKNKFSFRFNFTINKQIKTFFKSFLPVAFGMAVFQINRIVSNIFSSSFEGGNTIFEKSFIITQLVLSVIITGISTVSLPLIAKETKETQKTIYIDSLRMIVILILPFSIFLFLLGKEICAWLYQDLLIFLGLGTGKIENNTIVQMGKMLFYFAPGILLFALITLINRGFQGLKKFYYPVIGSSVSVVANYILMSSLVPKMGVNALPLSISISAFLNFLILFLMFKKITKVAYTPFYTSFAKSIIAATGLTFFISFAKNISLAPIIKLPLLGLLGLGLYAFILLLLKEQELVNLFLALKRKLKIKTKPKQIS